MVIPTSLGWDVTSLDGRKIGEVDDLLVDTNLLKVRYVEMKLDDDLVSDEDRRYAVLPIGTAQLDDDDDQVVVNVRADDMRTFPAYTRGHFSREQETALMARLSPAAPGVSPASGGSGRDFYGQPFFDDRRPFENRRAKLGRGNGDAQHITRSEEELAIGKRQVKAGSVGALRRVGTEHVRKAVPVMHEEVTVERRPIAADRTVDSKAAIGNDEIRIPVMQEEVVANKRVVAKEEIVIRKHAVQGEEIVEANLRKEHVDVNRAGNVQENTRDRSKTAR